MTNEEQMAALQAQLAALQQQTGGQGGAALSGWNKPQASGAINIQGVAVPVSVQTPIGKVRCYFWLGQESATPDGLLAALEQMSTAGVPIDAWEDKKSGWGNSGSRKNWR